MRTRIFIAMMIAILFAIHAHAADAQQDRLQICLRKAVDMPDIAVAEADGWVRQKGGNAALLCRATAQFHRGDFAKSGADFMHLAADEKDAPHAAFLYQQAGLAFTRASDFKNSEVAYNKALKLEAQDPDIWVSRASSRATAQHYWDAIGDLDQALKIMPDMVEGLRLRGQVWVKLGMDARAKADFRRVAAVEAEEDVVKAKTSKRAVTKK